MGGSTETPKRSGKVLKLPTYFRDLATRVSASGLSDRQSANELFFDQRGHLLDGVCIAWTSECRPRGIQQRGRLIALTLQQLLEHLLPLDGATQQTSIHRPTAALG